MPSKQRGFVSVNMQPLDLHTCCDILFSLQTLGELCTSLPRRGVRIYAWQSWSAEDEARCQVPDIRGENYLEVKLRE